MNRTTLSLFAGTAALAAVTAFAAVDSPYGYGGTDDQQPYDPTAYQGYEAAYDPAQQGYDDTPQGYGSASQGYGSTPQGYDPSQQPPGTGSQRPDGSQQ
ncbi:hypothetical protein [Streptomyces achromogenes]|uniref:hypothetical protein n=1 Tax=Streptomyces achromogenes TaxID=67255 RepID=UPI0036A98E49